MSVQSAIENITYRSEIFPEEEFQVLSENPEEAMPYLHAAIEKALEEQDDLEEEYQLHFYALYLLAQFQDKAFFPKIVEFVSLPPEVLDYLIGDAVTSGMNNVLYNTYNGDLELLKRAILNPDIDEYVRNAMLEVMGELYLDGSLEKDEWQAFIRGMIHESDGLGDCFYAEVADVICQCHFVEMLPEIRFLYENDMVDPSILGDYDNCVDLMFEYSKYRECFCETPLNAAETLRGWAMFSHEDEEPRMSEKEMEKAWKKLMKLYNKSEVKSTKIGRNEPCPCGSGKKYKHCCLNKPISPLDAIESARERAKWLEEYPPLAKDREEGHVYLEDFYDAESIEIDKVLYLALMHREIPLWEREEVADEWKRQRAYLSEAFLKFSEKVEKEGIKTFDEYDEKYSIHYFSREWMSVLRKLLKTGGDRELYIKVDACYRSMS